jgi:hypothetical protein
MRLMTWRALSISPWFPAEYDSRVKAMEVDEKPTEDYSDIGGLDKQIQAGLSATRAHSLFAHNNHIHILTPVSFSPLTSEPRHGSPSRGLTVYLLIVHRYTASNASHSQVPSS